MFNFVTIAGLLNAILISFLIPVKKVIWYIVIGQFLLILFFLFMFFIILGALLVFLFMKIKPRLFTKTVLTFTHWGMERDGETFTYTTPWSKFLKFTETKQYFFLLITDKESYVIQKRMLENDSEMKSFKLFISERIGQN